MKSTPCSTARLAPSLSDVVGLNVGVFGAEVAQQVGYSGEELLGSLLGARSRPARKYPAVNSAIASRSSRFTVEVGSGVVVCGCVLNRVGCAGCA